MRLRLEKIPGITISVQEDPDALQKPLQVVIRGEDIPMLKRYAGELKRELYKVRGIVDIEAALEQDLPEYRSSWTASAQPHGARDQSRGWHARRYWSAARRYHL